MFKVLLIFKVAMSQKSEQCHTESARASERTSIFDSECAEEAIWIRDLNVPVSSTTKWIQVLKKPLNQRSECASKQHN